MVKKEMEMSDWYKNFYEWVRDEYYPSIIEIQEHSIKTIKELLYIILPITCIIGFIFGYMIGKGIV